MFNLCVYLGYIFYYLLYIFLYVVIVLNFWSGLFLGTKITLLGTEKDHFKYLPLSPQTWLEKSGNTFFNSPLSHPLYARLYCSDKGSGPKCDRESRVLCFEDMPQKNDPM